MKQWLITSISAVEESPASKKDSADYFLQLTSVELLGSLLPHSDPTAVPLMISVIKSFLQHLGYSISLLAFAQGPSGQDSLPEELLCRTEQFNLHRFQTLGRVMLAALRNLLSQNNEQWKNVINSFVGQVLILHPFS